MLGLLAINPVSMMPINGWVSVLGIVYSLMFVLESVMMFCEFSG